MNKFKQIHRLNHCYGSTPFIADMVKFDQKFKRSNIIPVDQFFSQDHNLRCGFVDTSPAAFDNPQSATHVSPVSAERPLPAEMTDDEIHANVVSKSCQTLSEISALSGLRPRPEDFDSLENQPDEPPTEPATPESVSSDAPSE